MTDADVIHDRYVLGERLGLGGMSTVLLAFDRTLERHVAVKLLAEHLADDAQFVSRFRREALSAARLVHPNIVQVFDFGVDEASGRQFIVMEYVRGRSGAELLRERGVLPVREAMPILLQACKGLAYAHRNGVIHRDVKPGNLLRSEDDGVVKLADFGIAKAMTEESSITQVGSVLGTASYLAPEQASGQEAGPRADLYSLGVVAYQLLTGRLPYDAVSLTELALKQQREAPALAHDVNPDVPVPLAHAIDRALALEPEARFADAEAMEAALADGARGVGTTSWRADAPGSAATAHTGLAEIPPTAATRVGTSSFGGPSTGATSIAAGAAGAAAAQAARDAAAAARAGHDAAAGGSPSGGKGGVERRVPRPPREPRPAPVAPLSPKAAAERVAQPRTQRAAEAAGTKKKRSGLRRVVGFLLVLVLFAAGAAAAVIATSSTDQMIHLRKVVYEDVNQSIDAMQKLVKDNTQ